LAEARPNEHRYSVAFPRVRRQITDQRGPGTARREVVQRLLHLCVEGEPRLSDEVVTLALDDVRLPIRRSCDPEVLGQEEGLGEQDAADRVVRFLVALPARAMGIDQALHVRRARRHRFRS